MHLYACTSSGEYPWILHPKLTILTVIQTYAFWMTGIIGCKVVIYIYIYIVLILTKPVDAVITLLHAYWTLNVLHWFHYFGMSDQISPMVTQIDCWVAIASDHFCTLLYKECSSLHLPPFLLSGKGRQLTDNWNLEYSTEHAHLWHTVGAHG